MGRGPAIFFDCHRELRNCTLEIHEGTIITGSKIFDSENNTYIYDSLDDFSDIKAIFYTDVEPLIPASLINQIEQTFLI